MKKIDTILTSAVIALLCCLSFSGKAQNAAKTIAVDNFFNHVFDSDSLSGFDESANSALAVSNGCYGKEFKVFMNRAKRQYINAKYGVNVAAPLLPFQNDPMIIPTKIAAKFGASLPSSGACNNEDFEDNVSSSGPQVGGVVAGWSFFGGTGANFCNPPVVTGATTNYTVFNGPVTDGNMAGATIASYFDALSNTQPAGACFVRLNNSSSGGKVIRMSKTYTVSSTNALFQYAYRAVLDNPGHSCCDQPGFKITVTITNTVTSTSTVLSCPQVSVAAGTACGTSTSAPTFSTNGSYQYTSWIPSSIDLSSNIGNAVTLDVYAIDCALGGHDGYVYFDAKCSPMTIVGNNNPFPAGTPSINIPTCGSNGATITLPAGLGPYSWVGGPLNPVSPLSYGVPSFTNITYTTSVSGSYTVTMNPAGSCVPITKTLNVVITPAPQLFASIIQAGCSSTAALATCTAAGSASVNPSITWSPVPFALANSSTQATYLPPGTPTVLTVTATDNNNCPISKTLSLLPAPPAITFSVINTSLSNSITCSNPVVTLSATTSYTYGTLSYSWTSTSFTSAASSVSITQTQSIQATAWDPATGCSTSSVITVPINTIAPTSTVTPTSQTIACGSNAVQTLTSVVTNTNVNYSHCWFAPGASVPVCNTGTVSLFVIGAPGITTVVVTNPANGCKTTKTVNLFNSVGVPVFTVTSSTNFTLGCAPSKNTTTLNFVNAITSPTLGVPVSYTVLAPGFTGTYSIPNNPITSAVITIPGTYTVIIKDQFNNCESRVNVSITQNTVAPASVISVSNNAVNAFSLSCFTPSILAVGSSTVPNATIAWVTPSGTNIPQSSIPITITTNTASTSLGTYTLKVTDPNNGCTSFNPFPIAQSIQPPVAIITNSDTPNFINCAGDPVTLKNSSNPGPAGGVAVSVSWAGPTPQLPAGPLTQYNAFVAGVYTLTVRNIVNGCLAVGTLSVADNFIPPIFPSPINPFVLDCGASSVRIGVAPTNSTTGFQYNWTAEDPGNLQGITPTFTIGVPFTSVTKVGEYNVTVLNPVNGCSATQTFVVISGSLIADFTPSPASGFVPLAVSFINNSASTGTFAPTASVTSNWSFGNGGITTTTVNTTVSTTYINAGTYTVQLIAKKGICIDSVSKVITIDIPSKLTVPNVFTPNGDGANDKFKLLTQNLSNIEATIFDRWGNKVFEMTSDKGNIEWDGINLYGKEAANGTYFYVIKATGKDSKDYTEKGTVSLYR